MKTQYCGLGGDGSAISALEAFCTHFPGILSTSWLVQIAITMLLCSTPNHLAILLASLAATFTAPPPLNFAAPQPSNTHDKRFNKALNKVITYAKENVLVNNTNEFIISAKGLPDLRKALNVAGNNYGNETDGDDMIHPDVPSSNDNTTSLCNSTSSSSGNLSHPLFLRGCMQSVEVQHRPSRPGRPHYRCPRHWQDVWRDGFKIGRPRHDSSLFYSNFGPQAWVNLYAETPGLDIHGFIHKENYTRFVEASCDMHAFWRFSSEAMARRASGDVRVLLRAVNHKGPLYFTCRRSGRRMIWEDIEFPALRRNPHVNRVIRIVGWTQDSNAQMYEIYRGPNEP